MEENSNDILLYKIIIKAQYQNIREALRILKSGYSVDYQIAYPLPGGKNNPQANGISGVPGCMFTFGFDEERSYVIVSTGKLCMAPQWNSGTKRITKDPSTYTFCLEAVDKMTEIDIGKGIGALERLIADAEERTSDEVKTVIDQMLMHPLKLMNFFHIKHKDVPSNLIE